MPLGLTDAELAALIDAARPLHPRERSDFLREVIRELQKYEVIGAGVIGRTCSKLQRKYLMPRTGHSVGSKCGRRPEMKHFR